MTNLNIIDNSILQKNYIENIYSNLTKTIKNKFDVSVVSSHPNDYYKHKDLLVENGKPKIIFDLADEWHSVPKYYNNTDVILILKEYAPFDYFKYDKIIPFPVCFNYSTIEQVPIENRKYFLYCNMWLTPSREKLYHVLKNYQNDVNISINWNTNFNSGLPHNLYLKEMQNTIVTICPNGYISPEVSKMSEALMCGNIIIASQKPDYPYYKDNSFFIYEDEREIPEILNHIQKLSSQEKQNIIDKNNFMFNTKYCPEAIANILNERIHLCVS
jgi:hypothetical protein